MSADACQCCRPCRPPLRHLHRHLLLGGAHGDVGQRRIQQLLDDALRVENHFSSSRLQFVVVQLRQGLV